MSVLLQLMDRSNGKGMTDTVQTDIPGIRCRFRFYNFYRLQTFTEMSSRPTLKMRYTFSSQEEIRFFWDRILPHIGAESESQRQMHGDQTVFVSFGVSNKNQTIRSIHITGFQQKNFIQTQPAPPKHPQDY